MFELNGEYINRRGKYTVIEMYPPKMKVRFEDGEEVELNIRIQKRIWQNILAEREAVKRKTKKRKAPVAEAQTAHYVRALSLDTLEDTTILALQERLSYLRGGVSIKQGDRFIFYAIENTCFFAVGTSTGAPVSANRKVPKYIVNQYGTVFSLPLDWDATVPHLDQGVDLHTVELESQPNFKKLLEQDDLFLPINEDDFELVAELIAEQSEEFDDENILDEDDEDIEEEA